MHRPIALFLFAAIATIVCNAATCLAQLDDFGGFGDDSQEPLSATAYYKIKPDTNYGMLFVEATVGSGYHTYAQNHEGVEVPTKIVVANAPGISHPGLFKPTTKPHEEIKDGKPYRSFDGQVTWQMPFKVDDSAAAESLVIGVDFKSQVCTDSSCLPPKNRALVASFKGYDADLQVVESDLVAIDNPQGNSSTKEAATATTLSAADLAKFAELYDADSKINYEKLDGSSGTGTFLAAVFGAFFGGMLLNLMPCVFPVLGLKVLGFVEQAGNDASKIRMHGLAFSAGLIVSMWVLAGAILSLKFFYGQEVSWGQQMGNSYFVGGIVILLFVLGLNLVGVFEMGLFLTSVGSGGKKSEGYFGSFFSGILTTLVATPCSGPFLGAAMGYTLAQPPEIAMLLFTIFGIGIAMPYLVLSFIPALIHMLPPPGGWMETFKKLMGFTLFAAAAFFAQTFGSQTGNDGLSWLLLALCVLSLAAFFYGKFSPAYIDAGKRKIWGWVAPILIAGLGFWMYFDAAGLTAPKTLQEHSRWQTWTPGTVEMLLAQNKPVWVDYTATW